MALPVLTDAEMRGIDLARWSKRSIPEGSRLLSTRRTARALIRKHLGGASDEFADLLLQQLLRDWGLSRPYPRVFVIRFEPQFLAIALHRLMHQRVNPMGLTGSSPSSPLTMRNYP